MLLVALNVASVSPGHAQSESFPRRSIMIIDLTSGLSPRLILAISL